MKIYIEAGANDGLFQSRSLKHIDDQNYYGILIEPIYNQYIKCINNRQKYNCSIINCALVSFENNNTVMPINLHKLHSAMATFKNLGSLKIILKPAATFSWEAPPPTSRKFAGFPP